MSAPRMLIIDDDPDLSELIRAVAGDMGFDAAVCSDPSLLPDAYRDDLSAIVLDIVMPQIDGVEVLRFLAHKKCRAGIILVSATDQKLTRAVEKLAQDRELNFVGSLRKPFVPENLMAMLTKARLASAGRRLHRHPLAGSDATPGQDELLVMFQPKVDLQTLDFTSVEALVRWQHPTKGLLGPGFFIPAAERNGQIDALTERIFHKTLAQCNRWMKENLIITVSINVSARSLSDVTLPDRIADMLMCYHIQPSQIVLEITETWLSEDPVNCLDSLTRLALKGFRLSIDDFGTGYSSITQLSRIPFNELKIDQSFIRRAPRNMQARRILESNVELGHHLDMSVVAEGVETQDQWNLVQKAGCDECQGFFIARPLPAGSTPAWLERWAVMHKRRKLTPEYAAPVAAPPTSAIKM